MSGATMIRPAAEEMRLDPAQLARLYRDLGAEEADGVLTRATAEMTARVAALSRAYEAADLDEFARELRSLRRLAEHAGFLGLSVTATAVAACLESGDETALAATWARLVRLTRHAADRRSGLDDLTGRSS